MARIEGINPDQIEEDYIKRVFDAQARKWGAALLPYPIYARRPSIFRAVRGMWAGIDASGLIDGKLKALVNRRVASLNGCQF